jgi:hypothetical protein
VGDKAHWQSTGSLRAVTVPLASSVDQPADDAGTSLQWSIPVPDSYGSVKSTGPAARSLPHVGGVAIPPTAVWVEVSGSGLLGGLLTPVNTLIDNLVPVVQASLQAGVNNLVIGSVDGLVDAVNPLLGQLQGSLGLRLAGADVTVLPEASCGQPVSRG